MATIYYAFGKGTITNNPLGVDDLVIGSSAFSGMPVVAAPDTIWIVLDPDGSEGTPEFCKVIAHVSGTEQVTVTRGQQTAQGGFPAREHVFGTEWICAITPDDLEDFPHRRLSNKGDVIVGVGNHQVTTLTVGANGTVQMADSGSVAGVKWSLVDTVNLNDNAITANKILDGAVTSNKIQDNSIPSTKLQTDAVTSIKIANFAVDTNKINDNAITSGKILDSAVLTEKINALAVTTAKLADLGVTTAKINNLAVTPGKLDRSYIDYGIIDAKGNIVTGTAIDTPTVLFVGSNQQVLRADSSQSTGLKWDWQLFPLYTSTGLRDVAMTPATDGMAMYLNDGAATEGPYYYNGTAWRLPWNMPWGLVTSASSTSDQTGITTSVDITNLSVSWTGVANRLYRIAMVAYIQQVTSPATMTVSFRTASGGGGSILARVDDAIAATHVQGHQYACFQTGTGTLSVFSRVGCTAGTVSVLGATAKGWIVVEDLGPTGAPS